MKHFTLLLLLTSFSAHTAETAKVISADLAPGAVVAKRVAYEVELEKCQNNTDTTLICSVGFNDVIDSAFSAVNHKPLKGLVGSCAYSVFAYNTSNGYMVQVEQKNGEMTEYGKCEKEDLAAIKQQIDGRQVSVTRLSYKEF